MKIDLRYLYRILSMHLFIIFFLLFPFSFFGMETSADHAVELSQWRNESLLRSASEGKLSSVKLLSRLGADPNFTTVNNGSTALLEAVKYEDEKAVEFFLDYTPVDLKQIVRGQYIMDHSLERSDPKIFRLFALKKAPVRNPNTHLLRELDKNNFSKIRYLILNTDADVNLRSRDNTTALHKAAEQGDEELIEALLKKKANVNFENNFELTPLFFATKHTKSAQLLITNGANIHHQTSAQNSYQTPLFWAVMARNYELTSFLLSEGANCNLFDSRGNTPLHYAIERDDEKMVSLLLTYKANPNLKTTALTTTSFGLAVQKRRLKILDMFIANKTPANEPDLQRLTPLAHARIHGDYLVFLTLLKNGAQLESAQNIDFRVIAKQITLNSEIEKLINPTFFQKWFGFQPLGFRVAAFFASIKNSITSNCNPFTKWLKNKRSV